MRGHGVDAGLYGRDPDLEPMAADIHGIGSLLTPASLRGGLRYRCRTPGRTPENGQPIRPSRFVADIPEPLCRIIDTCWQAGTRLPPRSPLNCDSRQVRSVTDPARQVTARTP